MKKVYAIKEVVGDRFLEKAKDPDANFGIKYVFAYKSTSDQVETFDSVETAEAAYAQFLEHNSFTPFILLDVYVKE